MVTETQGNESIGSTENTGAETSGNEASSSSELADDPKYAEKEFGAEEAKTKDASETPEVKSAYAPNFKFKVFDKEQEFDDWLKGSIKDAETEKKARELYEKAFGLEHVKNDRQKLREQNQHMSGEIANHQNTVQAVNHWTSKKDYNSLFNFLGIPKHDVYSWVRDSLAKEDALANMPEAQRNAFLNAEQQASRAYTLEQENAAINQRYEQVAVAARTQELDWTLGRPEYAQAALAYDQRVGRPGAFKEAVIQRGQYQYLSSGQDLTAEQAVQQVLSFLGGSQALMPAQASAPVVTQPGQGMGSQPQVVAPQKVATMTNIQGRGTSPAKKVIKSIADLRKRADELAEA